MKYNEDNYIFSSAIIDEKDGDNTTVQKKIVFKIKCGRQELKGQVIFMEQGAMLDYAQVDIELQPNQNFNLPIKMLYEKILDYIQIRANEEGISRHHEVDKYYDLRSLSDNRILADQWKREIVPLLEERGYEDKNGALTKKYEPQN